VTGNCGKKKMKMKIMRVHPLGLQILLCKITFAVDSFVHPTSDDIVRIIKEIMNTYPRNNDR